MFKYGIFFSKNGPKNEICFQKINKINDKNIFRIILLVTIRKNCNDRVTTKPSKIVKEHNIQIFMTQNVPCVEKKGKTMFHTSGEKK